MKRKCIYKDNLKPDQGIDVSDGFVQFFERELVAHFSGGTRDSVTTKVATNTSRRR